jgi:hypothetical protein
MSGAPTTRSAITERGGAAWQGTRNKEQGTRNKEQGTRNKEQGTRNKIVGVIAVSCLVSSLQITGPKAEAQATDLNVIMDSTADAETKMQQAANFIALNEGRKPEDVREKMRLDDVAESYGKSKGKAPGFGGVWVEFDPLRVVVASTTGKANIEPLGSNRVEIRRVKRDLKKLERRADEVRSRLIAAQTGAFAISVDTVNNRLKVEGDEAAANFSKSLSEEPDEIESRIVDLRPAAVQGGEHLNNPDACTSGFSVRQYGTNYVTTAGHCPWQSLISLTNGGTEASNEMCSIDTQTLYPASGSSTGYVRNNAIKGYAYPSSPTTYIYSYGRKTGWRYGNAGNATNWFLGGGGQCVGSQIFGLQANGGNIDFQSGDSGGPIISSCNCGGFNAIGMISTQDEHYVSSYSLLYYGYSFATA